MTLLSPPLEYFWINMTWIFRLAAMFVVVALSTLTSAGMSAGGDSLCVSLVTCYPGPQIYELCGHEAIRIRGGGVDSVWNYGMFSFDEPGFVYRFVKGETDYMVVGYPWEWFMPEYIGRGSKVVEQDLALTQSEARSLLMLLRENALPENRRYRYNYVRDNCATRIVDMVERATDRRIVVDDRPSYSSFRREMRAYHRGYPWYQFGIDLALGSGIDSRIGGREEMFVPVEMEKRLSVARLSDGRRLVDGSRVLYEGRSGAVLPPTPWWAGPLFWSGVACVFMIVAAVVQTLRKRIYPLIYSIWFALCGLAGCLIAFLVFVSSHEATSPNLLIVWLNPLLLVPAVTVWIKRLRTFNRIFMVLECVALACMLLAWPFQPQSANPAFFLLIAATLIISLIYAVISPEIYNNNRGKGKTASLRRKRSLSSRIIK